jgi:hypothetical protein
MLVLQAENIATVPFHVAPNGDLEIRSATIQQRQQLNVRQGGYQ